MENIRNEVNGLKVKQISFCSVKMSCTLAIFDGMKFQQWVRHVREKQQNSQAIK